MGITINLDVITDIDDWEDDDDDPDPDNFFGTIFGASTNPEKKKYSKNLQKILKQLIILNTKYIVNLELNIKTSFITKNILEFSKKQDGIYISGDNPINKYIDNNIIPKAHVKGTRGNLTYSLDNLDIYDYLNLVIHKAINFKGTFYTLKTQYFDSFRFAAIEKLIISFNTNIKLGEEFYITVHIGKYGDFYKTVKELVDKIKSCKNDDEGNPGDYIIPIDYLFRTEVRAGDVSERSRALLNTTLETYTNWKSNPEGTLTNPFYWGPYDLISEYKRILKIIEDFRGIIKIINDHNPEEDSIVLL